MPGDLVLADQVRDLLRQRVRVHLVRQLGDDQADAALDLLDLDDRAHRDGAAPGAVRLLDALVAQDRRARGEVGALDAQQERREQLLARRLGVVQVPLDTLGHLAQVVRRDVGRHADRDAGRAVDQQVREPRRQDRRLLRAAVVVVLEVDGVLVDVPDHLHGQRRHLALGVPRGGRRVVARGAEVALAGHQRVPQRPVLHQADQGVVDRRVTVRVVLAHDVADDARALGELAVRAVAAVVHRVQHAAVHRLETVADVRQGAADDDGHGVVEVRPLHLQLQVDLVDAAVLDLVAGGLAQRGSLRSVLALPGPCALSIRCRGSARPSRCAG